MQLLTIKKFKFFSLIKIVLLLVVGFFLLIRFEIISQPMLNMSFRATDKKILAKFKSQSLAPQIQFHHFEGETIRYLKLEKNAKNPWVVFIHGAPGSLSDYLAYFQEDTLYRRANLISVDRLGYGYSEYGHAETSIQRQAAAIESVIHAACTNDDIVLVGHSYGGPVAVRLAMDYPRAFKKLILLAPALDPDHEKEVKIAYAAVNRAVSWIIPPAFKVAAYEKTTHVKEIKKMLPLYQNIQIPVCMIHGTKDSLVPFENMAFARKHFNAELFEGITLEGVDHFLPWSHHDLVLKTILKSLD